MAFRVELTKSAEADLEALYLWVTGRAPHQGAAWFNGLEEAMLSLDQHPERCPLASESTDPKRPVRVLHYGRARHVFRVLFWIDGATRVVYVLHVRRGARQASCRPGPGEGFHTSRD
jgi:plasmid stabilization system protein ParE